MSQQPLPSQDEINSQVTAALAEDLGGNADASADITANLIPASQQATATIITRSIVENDYTEEHVRRETCITLCE